jgi:hypothetical protein
MTTCWLVGMLVGVGVGLGVGEEGGLEEMELLPPQAEMMSETRSKGVVSRPGRFCRELTGNFIDLPPERHRSINRRVRNRKRTPRSFDAG